ncbi:MAG: hypothetical protein GY859_24835 [Desulfobacterales bacterium]|nr:hypothetical protein [Desulfobacterales bacterium]
MDLVFKILGIVFLVILIILGLGFLFIRRKWRQFKELAAMDGPMPPMKIHLNEDLDPRWKNEKEASTRIGEIKSFGFVEGRAYTVKEMPDVRFISFFSANREISVVFSKHDQEFFWTDFCVEYEDGSALTVSNAPMGDEMETRPEVKKLFLKETDIPGLYDVLKKEMAPGPKKKIDDENFRSEFEKSYQEDVEWIARQGGVSEEMVRTIAERDDMDLDEEEIQEAMREVKLKEIRNWHDACIENALERKKAPPEKWDLYKSKLFIVSELMQPLPFVEYLDERMDFTAKQCESFETLAKEMESITGLFKKINGSLSPDLRAKRVGRTSSPIKAEIYRRPKG